MGIDYFAIAPMVIVAVAALAVLAVDLFVPGRAREAAGIGALIGLVLALAATAFLMAGPPRGTFCWPEDLRGTGLASCSFVADEFTGVFQAIVLVAGVVVVLMAHAEIPATSLPSGEFHFLLLSSLTGAVTLVASRDLVTSVVSLEVLTLPVFALVALRRHDGRSAEAALKMFLISVVSTAIMLFGISLVYGVTGTLQLDRIAGALPLTGPAAPLTSAGVVLVLAGFGFKIAVVPFHFWAPDTYDGAPISVAAFLSVISKAAGFAGLILVLDKGFWPLAGEWGPVLAVLAAVSMTVGNLVAVRQRQVVRLLAWSSIAQAGYMLAPLGVLGGGPATVAYVAIYSAMNLGAFAVVALVGRRGATLDDYRGLVRERPLAGGALAFFLICLAGLPPGLAGLFAKIAVFGAVVNGGYGWLALVMAVNTVIGLYYYLTWIARLFSAGSANRGPMPRPAGIAIGVALAGTVALSVVPQLVFGISPS